MSVTRGVVFCPCSVRWSADLYRPDIGQADLSYVVMGQRRAASQCSLCASVRLITLRGRHIGASPSRPSAAPATGCAPGLGEPWATPRQGWVMSS
jgi:hypothetical protein